MGRSGRGAPPGVPPQNRRAPVGAGSASDAPTALTDRADRADWGGRSRTGTGTGTGTEARATDRATDRVARRRAEATAETAAASPAAKRRDRTARRTLGAALATTAASTLVPGSGHLLLRRTRTGAVILGLFLLLVAAALVVAFTLRRTTLVESVLSTSVLAAAALAALAIGLAWVAVVARTYALARPRNMGLGKKILGTGTAAVLCMAVAVPFGYAADLANSSRSLLNELFDGGPGGTDATVALGKDRLNVLLLGSDAGPDRTGTRTDTMMLASIDTTTGRTTLFGLPRNIQRAEFTPGTPMAKEFPNGFHDPSDPLSGNYLLNAVYAYAHEHPALAPKGPTDDIGLNLLQDSISYMTGLPIDYYLEVNMAGFSSLVDAMGGVTVNVGPTPIPINGVTADGRHVKPDGYIQPGVQNLDGEEALWFARSRRDSTDYDRMSRQRCLINSVLEQKSPADLIANFQSVATATKENVDTNIPQQVLPALAALAGEGFSLQSIAFDPSLPDPSEPDGKFNTGRPDVEYMRRVVQEALDPPAPAPTSAAAPSAPTTSPRAESTATSGSDETAEGRAAPSDLAQSCAATAAGATDQGPDTGGN
ncbi:transcriptional attenuator, LytR family [Pseudonocardia oroxyli]|uniref:Transcriptional attenuator, LytR family n=1 Tax=Pseudonocardia oroxyli TaxID=366584 RepID=A0A1G7VSL6_PSEOR|nr:transcriptional attenuator, LytR family [Pseudonocardia oroxyli]